MQMYLFKLYVASDIRIIVKKVGINSYFGKLFVLLRTTNNAKLMETKIITDQQQKLARYAKALGHPVRVYVLQLLGKQSCCYSGDLSDELPIAKSTLSQHLKELKDAGLIQGEIEAPRIKYCVNKENWAEAQELFKNFLKID